MDENKPTSTPLDFEKVKEDMRKHIEEEWDNFDDRTSLATAIMEGYIFGKYAESQHYNLSDVRALVDEVYAIKNPPKPAEDLKNP
jgi:hypothetical protein